jgi:eukaryotic-like serine/threonine-protein kinase
MGTVYLAQDLSLERPVALKILRRDLADQPHLFDRLVTEARAQARLQHPNVVTIHYIGRFEGVPYFAMEYVRGEDLADHIARVGPLDWTSALECVIQTTRVLMEAHHRGLVHRDVKPSNLILTSTLGRSHIHVKVADFGLATPPGLREEHFAGSPYYAAPEQMQGQPPDFRSDIYSLGVTFYELLMGAPPFQSESLPDLLHLHLSAPRPAIDARRAPWRLRQLISEMMAPEPADRPWTYEELLRRLEEVRPKPTIAGGLVARGMALGLDFTLVLLTLQALLGLLGLPQAWLSELSLGLFGAYYVLAHRVWGRTLGKRLFGLRIRGTTRAVRVPGLVLRFVAQFWAPILGVIMMRSGLGATTSLEALKDDVTRLVGVERIPILDALTESAFQSILMPNFALLAIPWLGGFLMALFNEHRQALHDRVSRTRVVYSIREGLDDVEARAA